MGKNTEVVIGIGAILSAATIVICVFGLLPWWVGWLAILGLVVTMFSCGTRE